MKFQFSCFKNIIWLFSMSLALSSCASTETSDDSSRHVAAVASAPSSIPNTGESHWLCQIVNSGDRGIADFTGFDITLNGERVGVKALAKRFGSTDSRHPMEPQPNWGLLSGLNGGFDWTIGKAQVLGPQVVFDIRAELHMDDGEENFHMQIDPQSRDLTVLYFSPPGDDGGREIHATGHFSCKN